MKFNFTRNLRAPSTKMRILLRVTPGVEAHTHDFITTGQADSKFGFDLNNGQADEAFQQTFNHEYLELLGLHCHIGSQIFDTAGFGLAGEKLIDKISDWKKTHDFTCTVLNLGGASEFVILRKMHRLSHKYM